MIGNTRQTGGRQEATRQDATRPVMVRQAGVPRHSGMRALRLACWSVAHFAFYFLQQLAELVAPLLLVLGLGWWALPRLVDAITTHEANADQQTRDILDTVAGTIPHGLRLAGHWITPAGLITDGLLLMAVAAIGATISALAAREM